MKVKITGMNNIIFACRGSPITGCIFCWTNIDAPISSGRIYVGSYAARSQIHRSCPPSKGIHFGTSPETDERRVLHLH